MSIIMGAFTINDVFRSVILATLKSSNNIALRTAYDQILDNLDYDRTSPLLIQSVCARQFGVPRSDTRIHLKGS